MMKEKISEGIEKSMDKIGDTVSSAAKNCYSGVKSFIGGISIGIGTAIAAW